jgi:DNA-directed RNA polymerase subunit RPC12/RpoP
MTDTTKKITVKGKMLREREKCFLLKTTAWGQEKKIWLLRDLVEIKRITMQDVEITLPEWLAIRRGVVKRPNKQKNMVKKHTNQLLYNCMECGEPNRFYQREFDRASKPRCEACGCRELELDTIEFSNKIKSDKRRSNDS